MGYAPGPVPDPQFTKNSGDCLESDLRGHKQPESCLTEVQCCFPNNEASWMKLCHDLCNRWALAVFTTAKAPPTGVFAGAHRFDRPFGPLHMGGLIGVSSRCMRWKHRLTLVGLPNKHFLVKGGETPPPCSRQFWAFLTGCARKVLTKTCYWPAFSDCGASALIHGFVVHLLLPH